MKKIYLTLLFNLLLFISASAQTTLLETSFEGPGFDEGWTMGVSQAITQAPQDYPATGLDPWEKWDITDATPFGYVHSGDSAAWIGGTMYPETTHDWLMTPVISIPENENAVINYWLWYHSEAMYINYFYIMIYDMESETWNEVYKLANDFNSPYHYTEPYKLDISEWNGKDVKVAFVKNGTYQMAMDDINIISYNNDNLNENTKSNMMVYPNPANEILNVKIETIPNNNVLTITDVTGRIVIRTTIVDNTSNIDISDLNAGIYIVTLDKYRTKLIVI
ncbi:MAG: T9SS type A sorting domain-containing protein [Bacteroidales bacterium]|nr:T9SS type A sorting domain-containing protein [Bacteroidales bacterium]